MAAAETQLQLQIIREVRDALTAAGVGWWLFGGWAMDFHAGRITRDHSDIEIFVRRDDIRRAREALVVRGFAAPPGLYPEEAQPFLKGGQEIGLWFIVTDGDGRTFTPGRWAEWPWPAGSFDGPHARLGELEAPVMSLEGLLEMKLGFAAQPHGAPLREKDIADIALLRAMIEGRANA